MKTKIFFKYILAAYIAFSMAACNADFLDEVNPNEATEATSWTTIEEAESAMATIYSPIRGQMYGYFGAFTGFQNQNVRGDDLHPIQDDPETWKLTIFTNDPNTGRVTDDWDLLYRSINRANNFLANIDRVEAPQTEKDTLISEAHFLRAWNYFMLVINWGDVPLRLIPATSDVVMVPSSPESEVWAQIEKDLEAAKINLPIERKEKYLGRATRGAAIAYLGRAYIYQGKYAEGKAELEQLMKDPYKYELIEDPDQNYTETNEFNKESIFEINYYQYGTGGVWGNDDMNTPQVNILSNFVGAPPGGWYKLQPSKSIVDEFTKEERPEGADSRWDKRMYTNFFFKYSDYNDVKPDMRWYGKNSIPMDTLWLKTASKRIGNEPNYSDIDGKPGRFIIKKFTAFWSDNGDSMYNTEKNTNNIRVMRYAEVLLLHAEACAKTGDIGGANASLKQIRDRAGLADKTFGSEQELMQEIEHQRLLEFFLEGHRFYDLKRWYTWSQMKEIFERRGKLGASNFENKHIYYPIPQGEINTNTAIQQHPLW